MLEGVYAGVHYIEYTTPVSVEVEWRSPGRVVTGMKPYLCRLLMSSREGDNLSGEPR